MRLYASVADIAAEALGRRDRSLASAAMWAWAVDAAPRDHEFVVRVGVVDSLTRLVSLNAKTLELAGAKPAAVGDDAELDAGIEPWVSWDVNATRLRLLDGSLTKQEVVAHMLAAPARFGAGVAWLRSQGFDTPERAAAQPVSDVLALQGGFTRVLLEGESGSAAAAAASSFDAMVPTDKDPSLAAPGPETVPRAALQRAGSLVHQNHSHSLTHSEDNSDCGGLRPSPRQATPLAPLPVLARRHESLPPLLL